MGLELRARSRGTGTTMNRKTLPADCHRSRRTVAPNGFTLMELLIVIAVILILMLMAMKTIGSHEDSRQRVVGDQFDPRDYIGRDVSTNPLTGPTATPAI